jgi:hypothetical protein
VREPLTPAHAGLLLLQLSFNFIESQNDGRIHAALIVADLFGSGGKVAGAGEGQTDHYAEQAPAPPVVALIDNHFATRPVCEIKTAQALGLPANHGFEFPAAGHVAETDIYG